MPLARAPTTPLNGAGPYEPSASKKNSRVILTNGASPGPSGSPRYRVDTYGPRARQEKRAGRALHFVGWGHHGPAGNGARPGPQYPPLAPLNRTGRAPLQKNPPILSYAAWPGRHDPFLRQGNVRAGTRKVPKSGNFGGMALGRARITPRNGAVPHGPRAWEQKSGYFVVRGLPGPACHQENTNA
jgi:hypothetical protein